MRKQARALILALCSLLLVMTLGVASALVSALALAATALIVPGTGTPDPQHTKDYTAQAWNRYIDGLVCTDPGTCSNPTLEGIPYPASFWPLSFIPGWCVAGRCEKWNDSVGVGVDHLEAALAPLLDPTSTEDVYIFGYSQGGAVVADTLAYLKTLNLSDDVKSRLKIITIGGIENPDGGLWQRLSWLRHLVGDPVPILDVSLEPGMATDSGIQSTTIGFEYDPVVYSPRYWGNALAVLNALAALETVHGSYLAPNGNNDGTLPYGYDDATLADQLSCSAHPSNCRKDSYGNTYIMVPATSLPLTDMVRSLANSLGIGSLAKPFIDLVEPALRVMVDLGYDWTGDPGKTVGSSILPFKIFQNWIKVGVDLTAASVQGVKAFINDLRPDPATTRPKTTDTDIAPPSLPADRKTARTARETVAAEGEAVTADPGAAKPSEDASVAAGAREKPAVKAGQDRAAVTEDTTATGTPPADSTDETVSGNAASAGGQDDSANTPKVQKHPRRTRESHGGRPHARNGGTEGDTKAAA